MVRLRFVGEVGGGAYPDRVMSAAAVRSWGPAFRAVTVGVDSSAEEGGGAEFLCYGCNTKRVRRTRTVKWWLRGVGRMLNQELSASIGCAARRTMRSLILRPVRLSTS